MSNWEYYFKTILKYGIYLVLVVPLIYYPDTLFPFILGKTLFFRATIEIMAAIYIVLAIAFPLYRPKKSCLLCAILAYAGIVVLATMFSVDPPRSFWSNHERMMGFWTLAHAIALFIITSNIFKTKNEWRNFFGFSVLISIIVGFLGIYQYFSSGFLHIAGGSRVYSTLGNYIYFGGYGLFHVMISLIFLLREKKKISIAGLFWAAGCLVGIISIYLSGTRGVFVAFCAAIFLSILAYLFFSKSKKIRLAAVFLLLFVLLSGFIVWLNREADWIKNSGLFASFVNISVTSVTGQTRLLNWQTAFEAWKQHPIFGWGPDTYYIAFNKNYNPKFFEYSAYETWQDHAHNIVFDTLNESGIAGLLAYFAIFLSAFYLIWKSVKEGKMEFFTGVVVFALLSAYFIQNLFVFDTLTWLILFYLILAFIQSSFVGGAEAEKNHEMSDFAKKLYIPYRYVLVFGLLMITLFFVYLTDITQFRASNMTINALRQAGANFPAAVQEIKQAMELKSPYLQETRDEFAKLVLMALQANANLTGEQVKSLMADAEKGLLKNLEEHPLDVYHWNFLGQIYFAMAQVLGDNSYYEKSKQAIDKAIEMSPKRQQVYFTLIRYYLIVGDQENALKTAQKAVDLAPDVRESRWNRGLVLASTNRLKEAYEDFKFAKDKVMEISNKQDIYPALKSSVAVNDKTMAIWLYSSMENMSPNVMDYIKFANAFRQLGDTERMNDARQKALNFGAGTAAQVDEYINNNEILQ